MFTMQFLWQEVVDQKLLIVLKWQSPLCLYKQTRQPAHLLDSNVLNIVRSVEWNFESSNERQEPGWNRVGCVQKINSIFENQMRMSLITFQLVLLSTIIIIIVYSLLLARGYSVDFTQYPWS